MVPSVATEEIPSDTTGDRSRESLTGSGVPEPIRYLRIPYYIYIYYTRKCKDAKLAALLGSIPN
jgi:hypothetical protein